MIGDMVAIVLVLLIVVLLFVPALTEVVLGTVLVTGSVALWRIRTR